MSGSKWAPVSAGESGGSNEANWKRLMGHCLKKDITEVINIIELMTNYALGRWIVGRTAAWSG